MLKSAAACRQCSLSAYFMNDFAPKGCQHKMSPANHINKRYFAEEIPHKTEYNLCIQPVVNREKIDRTDSRNNKIIFSTIEQAAFRISICPILAYILDSTQFIIRYIFLHFRWKKTRHGHKHVDSKTRERKWKKLQTVRVENQSQIFSTAWYHFRVHFSRKILMDVPVVAGCFIENL